MSNQVGGPADHIDQTYTVNLSSEDRDGVWRLRVRDADAGDVGYINNWGLTLDVPGQALCTNTNNTDVPIPDMNTAASTLLFSGCVGKASATSTVEVHIVHTFRGDLVVVLFARTAPRTHPYPPIPQ
ncbi:proprotein convertase P-domain-containing protein [Dactylosporangium cerinum]